MHNQQPKETPEEQLHRLTKHLNIDRTKPGVWTLPNGKTNLTTKYDENNINRWNMTRWFMFHSRFFDKYRWIYRLNYNWWNFKTKVYRKLHLLIPNTDVPIWTKYKNK